MKKMLSLIAVLSLAVLLFGCSAPKASNEGYKLYRSSPVGVEIEYPDFWEKVDNKTERSVAFAAPNEGYADKFRDNVTIISEEIGDDPLAFDNYVLGYIKQLPSTINKYSKISEQETTVGENRAYNVVYEGDTESNELRLSQTFIQSGKYVYIFTFMAEPSSYEYFLKNADVMLSTLKTLRK
ncbi:MAG: hypothetical protein IJ408_01390 [Clostridia bacterium]|nr:hypothetical protein [Clostridia bacterium]